MIKILRLFIFFSCFFAFSQPIKLFKQYTGRYDFFMIGNTMNTVPNGINSPCTILTQSSALLNLNANANIQAAFLYWSGSGTLAEADLNVQLNGTPITAQKTFTTVGPTGLEFFGAFADVTNFVKTTGNVNYTLSNLDLTNVIPPYCPTGSNYAGWSIMVVYEDTTLPNRVVSVYEGFQIVDHTGQTATITLNGLNVTNVNNAKVGFLAWEGDENIAVEEELRINGKIVSNPPLNPANNVFNSTNTYTNATNLWNMDIDYFQVGSLIALGDTSMTVQIKTGQDLIIVNNILVALSSLFADATISIDKIEVECNSRKIKVNYTIYNINGTTQLVNNVPIAFYADDVLVGSTTTKNSIPINGSETGTVTLTIPESVTNDFTLVANVDDDGDKNSTIIEIDETNNTDSENVTLIFGPEVNEPTDIVVCDKDEKGFVIFDLTSKQFEASTSTNVNISFHGSKNEAEKGNGAIDDFDYYELKSHTSKTIWIRVEDKVTGCASTTSFKITAQMKPFTELKEPLMICNFKNNPSAANLSLAYILLKRIFPYVDEMQLSFYEAEADAESEINEITNINNYQPPRFPYIIYIKGKGTKLWCDNIIELQLNDCVVPKGISPNGDGLNDGFDIEIFNPIEVKIFNRYGMEVYAHGEGYTNQWIGQDKNNRELPSGTYYYIFKTLFDTYLGYVYVIKEVR
ncbi:MAG: gliding motility-associated C-terminal domain-containing protein [Flavobacterium sp.]